jgi:5-formyltetrahydrofolate cyclo-ligase
MCLQFTGHLPGTRRVRVLQVCPSTPEESQLRTRDTHPGKPSLRRAVLARRNALSRDEVARRSAAAADHLFSLPEFAGARVIMFFVAFGSEIDTLPMIARALGMGKRVAAPRADPESRSLMPCEITQPDRDLVPGAYGIREPKPGCPVVALDDIDVVLVPAAVWSEDGYRLGYGAGYYDRFLLRLPRAHRIGLGLEIQVVARVPHTCRDLPVDMLVTEAGVRRFSRRRGPGSGEDRGG